MLHSVNKVDSASSFSCVITHDSKIPHGVTSTRFTPFGWVTPFQIAFATVTITCW